MIYRIFIIEEVISNMHDLQPGDRIPWECAQFDGIAEVIECGGKGICTIKKIS